MMEYLTASFECPHLDTSNDEQKVKPFCLQNICYWNFEASNALRSLMKFAMFALFYQRILV